VGSGGSVGEHASGWALLPLADGTSARKEIAGGSMYGFRLPAKYLPRAARGDRRFPHSSGSSRARRRNIDLRAMFMKLSDHPTRFRAAMAGFQKQYEQEASAKAKAKRPRRSGSERLGCPAGIIGTHRHIS